MNPQRGTDEIIVTELSSMRLKVCRKELLLSRCPSQCQGSSLPYRVECQSTM
jgi:hypothetical protein